MTSKYTDFVNFVLFKIKKNHCAFFLNVGITSMV